MAASPPSLAPRAHIDIGPDQRHRPQREAEDQRDPARDGDSLRLRMAAAFGDVAGQPAHDAEHRDKARDQDHENNPGEDVEAGHVRTIPMQACNDVE
jgi:hypothetical protein